VLESETSQPRRKNKVRRRSSPLAKDVVGDVLEGVVLHLVVRLEDPPDGQDVTTGEVERAALSKAPAIGLSVAVSALVVALDSAEIGRDGPFCVI